MLVAKEVEGFSIDLDEHREELITECRRREKFNRWPHQTEGTKIVGGDS
jgi:hypothetical protein